MTVNTAIPSDSRGARALELYRIRGAEIVRTAPFVYNVPSCSGDGFYVVDYRAETCDCEDALRHPDLNCKHLQAVGVARAKRRRVA